LKIHSDSSRRMPPPLFSEWADVRSRLARIATVPAAVEIHGAEAHRWILEPPLSVKEISELESQLRVELPDDYRSFLVQAGRGGAGPSYGIFPLRKTNGRWEWDSDDDAPGLTDMDRLSEPFPHTEAFNPHDLLPPQPIESEFETTESFYRASDSWERQWERIILAPENSSGLLFLCHHGCALRDAMVVSGQSRGRMWADRITEGQGYVPLFDDDGTPLNFAGWYRRWLNGVERRLGLATEAGAASRGEASDVG
jgi:hypothetical protein